MLAPSKVVMNQSANFWVLLKLSGYSIIFKVGSCKAHRGGRDHGK